MGFSNERMRTGQLVNWFLLDGLEMSPAGNPITKALPLPFGVDHLIGFNELLTCRHPESAGVHFFLDDYQFERFWRQPQRYLDALAKFPMVLGPTFSLYTDFPGPDPALEPLPQPISGSMASGQRCLLHSGPWMGGLRQLRLVLRWTQQGRCSGDQFPGHRSAQQHQGCIPAGFCRHAGRL